MCRASRLQPCADLGIFYTFNDGTRNQSVLMVSEGVFNERLLLDPNSIEAAGTTAVTAFEPDDAGSRVVYALSQRGSDVQELKVRDVETGADLEDVIQWVKFASIAWRGDGFFYTRYPAAGTVTAEQAQYFCQVWFHCSDGRNPTMRSSTTGPTCPRPCSKST